MSENCFFLGLGHIKTRYQNRLDSQHDMQVAHSEKGTVLDKIIELKQQAPINRICVTTRLLVDKAVNNVGR